MSRKRKELPILQNVIVEDVAAEGMALAHWDGKVLFMPYVVPGDIADVKVLKCKKNYCEGRVVAIKKNVGEKGGTAMPAFRSMRWLQMANARLQVAT